MTEAGRSEAAAEGRGADPALPPPAPGSGGSLNFFVFILRVAFYFSSLFFSFFPPLFFFFPTPLPRSLLFLSPLPARSGHTLRSASCEPAARGRGGCAGGGTWCAAAAPPAPPSSARAAGGRPPGLRPRDSSAPPGCIPSPEGNFAQDPAAGGREGSAKRRGGKIELIIIIIIIKIDKPHDAGARPGGLPVSEEPPLDSRKAEPGVGAVREPRRSSPPPAARQPRRPEPFLASRRLME